MTDGDNDERDLLAAARRRLSPTASDQARVWGRVAAALEAGTEPTGPGPASRLLPWAGRLAVVGVAAALAGGLGYRAGYHAARRESPAAGTSLTPTIAAPARRVPAVPSAVAPAPTTPATRPAPHRRAAPDAAVVPASADSLAEELRALRSIERALRDRNPGFALALLRELDRAVPNGKLVEEREAQRAIARCASDAVPMGVNLADDFVAHYPASVYGRRVADACAGTDSSPLGDKAGQRSSP